VLGTRPLAMYYYTPGLGLESLQQHAAEMTLLAPQCFVVSAEGFVFGEVPPQVLEIARAAKLPVMPLVVNRGFDRSTVRLLLRDPRAQERAALYMAYLAKRDNFLGWQLDLENLDPADKLLYTRFVERVAVRLHRDGRLLSVAVVPRFSDAYPARVQEPFPTGEWGAPYDFRALGRVADFLTLMTYNHHTSATPPGPVAGHAWVKAALDYAVRRVPPSKLLLGIPFYGRQWLTSPQGTTSSSLGLKDVKPLLDKFRLEPQWDDGGRTAWFQVQDGDTQRTAWFDNTRSLREKLKLMQSYRLRGFAAWRLGVEDPDFWPMAAEFRQPPAAPSATAAKKAVGQFPAR
jgi:spore germination protein YaaH